MAFAIPQNKSQWEQVAKRFECDTIQINDLEDAFIASASKIGNEQYLSLRVLWKVYEPLDPPLPFHNGEELRDEARKFLRTHKAWLEYWAAFDAKVNNIDNPGALSMVRLYQKASFTPLPPGKSRIKVSPCSKHLRNRFSHPNYAQESDDTDEESGDEESQTEEHETEISKGLALTTLTKPLYLGGLQTPDNSKRLSVVTPQTPATRATSSPAEDEAIVNAGFVLFLQGLCIWSPRLCKHGGDVPKWTMKRLKLIFTTTKLHDGKSRSTKTQQQIKSNRNKTSGQTRKVKTKKAWKAWTDGFLRVGTRAVIIIEVKPSLRYEDLCAIQKQEAAQMAAWIKSCPEDHHECKKGHRKFYRRLLISQDSYEIYMTIGEYDKNYVEYLDRKSTDPEPHFLTMHQYGPWDIRRRKMVESAATLLLACTLSEIPATGGSDDPLWTRTRVELNSGNAGVIWSIEMERLGFRGFW